MSYPIDIEAAKNTKLFKKFMENKNKSVVMGGPKIQNITFDTKEPYENFSTFNTNTKDIISPKVFVSNEISKNENDYVMQAPKPIIPIQRQTIRKIFESNRSNQKQKEFSQQKYGQRKTDETRNRDMEEGNKKYENLLEDYNELKEKLSLQRKENKKEIIKLQQQIQILNRKIFQLRNKQDELILQTKRLKEKNTADNKERQQMQQANRELSYQIKQLRDMLNGQENSSKKKEDEASHWKKVSDDLRQRNKQLEVEVQKQKDICHMLEREKFFMEKELSSKDTIANDLRDKIEALINENGVIKDQMYRITSKLYQFEQQNQSLRADLRRQREQFPISYLQQQLQQARHSKTQYTPSHDVSATKQQIIPEGDRKTQRRRGQFARQRGMRKTQTLTSDQKPNLNQQPNQTLQQKKVPQNQGRNIGEAIRKIQQLNEELQKMKDMKAMSGAMRRQKINMEREILELQQFIKSQQ